MSPCRCCRCRRRSPTRLCPKATANGLEREMRPCFGESGGRPFQRWHTCRKSEHKCFCVQTTNRKKYLHNYFQKQFLLPLRNPACRKHNWLGTTGVWGDFNLFERLFNVLTSFLLSRSIASCWLHRLSLHWFTFPRLLPFGLWSSAETGLCWLKREEGISQVKSFDSQLEISWWHEKLNGRTSDSFSTKRNLQRKLKPDVT